MSITDKKRAEILIQIGELVDQLGWSTIIPMTPGSDHIDGVIFGTTEFLEQILYRFQDNNDEVVYLDKNNENKILSKIEKGNKKTDSDDGDGSPTFH